MTTSPHDTLYINNAVPFSGSITCWQALNNVSFDDWVKRSRGYDAAYVAWEIVRKNRNPFFVTGTGFEGYYIGVCQSPQEVLNEIISMSQRILHSLTHDYRHNYGFKSRLMKTLTGELEDVDAIQTWAACFGAAIGRLRCNLHHNREGDLFRIETYNTVRTLPPICYEQQHRNIQQTYSLGFRDMHPKIQINMSGVKASDQDAWLVAWSIGQFGHPLVRAYLRENHRIIPNSLY